MKIIFQKQIRAGILKKISYHLESTELNFERNFPCQSIQPRNLQDLLYANLT